MDPALPALLDQPAADVLEERADEAPAAGPPGFAVVVAEAAPEIMPLQDAIPLQDAMPSLPLDSAQQIVAADAVAAGGPPEAPIERAVPKARAAAHDRIPWETVECPVCGTEHVGEFKFDSAPGNRKAVWIMRVKLRDGTWPNQGKFFRTRRTSQIGETPEGAKTWIQDNQRCCPAYDTEPEAGPARGAQATRRQRARLSECLADRRAA